MPESKIQDLIDLVREREQGNDDLTEDLDAAEAEWEGLREKIEEAQAAAEIFKHTAEVRGHSVGHLLKVLCALLDLARQHGAHDDEIPVRAARIALGEIKP
mgnify:FL=1